MIDSKTESEGHYNDPLSKISMSLYILDSSGSNNKSLSIINKSWLTRQCCYGQTIWTICCACYCYSLKQNIYLGSTVGQVGGKNVVLQQTQACLGKGHVIYCDRFFSHLDLAAYLCSQQTGMVNTSTLTMLPHDLEYLVRSMHRLTIIRRTSNAILEQEKVLRNNCMQKNLFACLFGWTRNSAPRKRKLSLSPTLYQLFPNHSKTNVI